MQLDPVFVVEVGVAAVQGVHIVQLDHGPSDRVLKHVFLGLVELDHRCDLVDFLHELDQLSRAQSDEFAEDYGELAVRGIQEGLSCVTALLDRIVERIRLVFYRRRAVEEAETYERVRIDFALTILEYGRVNEARDARVVPFQVIPGRRRERPPKCFYRDSLTVSCLVYFTDGGRSSHSLRENVRICSREGKAHLKSLERVAFDLRRHQICLSVREIVPTASTTDAHYQKKFARVEFVFLLFY